MSARTLTRTPPVGPLSLAALAAASLWHISAAQAAPGSPSPQPSTQRSTDDVKTLEQRLEADECRLRELERKQRQEQQERRSDRREQRSDSVATASAQWGPKGLAIASADGSNVLRLGALIQADGRYFADAATPSTANTWLLRRVRPILQGTIGDIL